MKPPSAPIDCGHNTSSMELAVRHHRMAALVLCGLVSSAHAVYKCPQSGGGTVFQEMPCRGADGQQLQVRSRATPTAPSASGAGTGGQGKQLTVEQRLVKTLERDRRIREANQEIADTEARIARRNEQMGRELDALRTQQSQASTNLAGATYRQSLSLEMQAVASKYKTMNDVDVERLRSLRATLATLQAAAPQSK